LIFLCFADQAVTVALPEKPCLPQFYMDSIMALPGRSCYGSAQSLKSACMMY